MSEAETEVRKWFDPGMIEKVPYDVLETIIANWAARKLGPSTRIRASGGSWYIRDVTGVGGELIQTMSTPSPLTNRQATDAMEGMFYLWAGKEWGVRFSAPDPVEENRE
jgi:hypothetical protein